MAEQLDERFPYEPMEWTLGFGRLVILGGM
jgi:hypothetical protein